jgi:hypothetical protein
MTQILITTLWEVEKPLDESWGPLKGKTWFSGDLTHSKTTGIPKGPGLHLVPYASPAPAGAKARKDAPDALLYLSGVLLAALVWDDCNGVLEGQVSDGAGIVIEPIEPNPERQEEDTPSYSVYLCQYAALNEKANA